ncbi:hypothetical protein SAMN05216338_100564 [Bradyrhizobium sp. Rc2d]|uniref:FHIPEP family type III secretion protein n=1 Tax=Bradyrhizobium sp. Rc2d TaxID=1855321 RepID=UPI000887D704|nr:FHIPEP family type III secretion protein [Bradyrhizobium sp. Rc2d]SDH07615.1 hypothetical protein SAMN05216338_100564 [Bradyrhizobium sp. Rc2d]
MTTSKTIAGLIGPTLVAIAAGMLLNIGSFPELAEQVSRDPALIFVSGILLFVVGLAIVRAHNRWTKEWPACDHPWLACHPQWPCCSQPAWPQLPAELVRPPARSFQEPSCFWGSAPSSRSRHIDVIEHVLSLHHMMRAIPLLDIAHFDHGARDFWNASAALQDSDLTNRPSQPRAY